MKVSETQAAPATKVLPGADFADAWQVRGVAPGDDAEAIASRIFRTTPWWVKALLVLRNALVAPFGLRGSGSRSTPPTLFPIVSAQPNRVVLGIDDKHLDFRLVVEMNMMARNNLAATATTYVRTHNAAGRLYLRVVKPFHRVIVPAMLRRAVAEATG